MTLHSNNVISQHNTKCKPVFHHHATYETYATHATACVIFYAVQMALREKLRKQLRQGSLYWPSDQRSMWKHQKWGHVTRQKRLLNYAERTDYSTKYFNVSMRINAVWFVLYLDFYFCFAFPLSLSLSLSISVCDKQQWVLVWKTKGTIFCVQNRQLNGK